MDIKSKHSLIRVSEEVPVVIRIPAIPTLHGLLESRWSSRSRRQNMKLGLLFSKLCTVLGSSALKVAR